MQRRTELPQRRLHDGGGIDVAGDSTDCERFMKRGACRVFNEFGRCNFHHPLDVHVIEIPPARCPQVPNYPYLVLLVSSGPREALKASGTPFSRRDARGGT